MNFIVENYNWWRAGHLIFVIFWMAGLMFLPRKFVYQFQTKPGSAASQALILQQQKLIKIILNPSLVFVWVFGGLLLLSAGGQAGSWTVFGQTSWIIKLVSVSMVTAIHFYYLAHHKFFAKEQRTKTEKFWRVMNEVPAVLAIIIVITAVVFL